MSSITRPVAEGIARLRALATNGRRGLRDVALTAVAQGIQAVAGLGTSVVVARALGPDGTGLHALAFSVGGIALTLSDVGMNLTALRYASRAADAGDEEGLAEAFAWSIRRRVPLVGVVALLFALFAGPLNDAVWNKPGLDTLIRIALWTTVTGAFTPMPWLVAQSRRQFGRSAVLQATQAVLGFATVGAAALWIELDPGRVLWANVVSGLLQLALVFTIDRTLLRRIAAHVLKPQRVSVDADDREHFATWLVVAAILVGLQVRLDLWGVGAVLGDTAAGLYTAGQRVAQPLAMILTAVNTAIWPRASAVTDAEGTRRLMFRAFALSSALAAMGVVYAFAAPVVLPLIFGTRFSTAGHVAELLSLRQCFALLTAPVAIVGYNLGLVRFYALMNAAQLVLTAGLLAWLLGPLGVDGAAWTLLGSDVLGFVLTVGAIRWNLRRARA